MGKRRTLDFDLIDFPEGGIDIKKVKDHLEWHLIWKAAFVAKGNISKIARLLNISRAGLYNRMETLKIEIPRGAFYYTEERKSKWDMESH